MPKLTRILSWNKTNINTFNSHCFPHYLECLPKHPNESGSNGPLIRMLTKILKRVHACTRDAEYKDGQSGTQCPETIVRKQLYTSYLIICKTNLKKWKLIIYPLWQNKKKSGIILRFWLSQEYLVHLQILLYNPKSIYSRTSINY